MFIKNLTMEKKLSYILLLTRISIFIVFLMWGLDKIINPDHGARVMSKFYYLDFELDIMVCIGYIQMLLLATFVLGCFKKYTYGLIVIFHGVSTFSSMPQYLDPFNHLLFFAAWPMLIACVFLYVFKEYDTITLKCLKCKYLKD